MYAAHYKLDNLVAIIDRNNLQIDGDTEDVMALGDVAGKFAAFGWEVVEVDGHNVESVYAILTASRVTDKPYAVVARTTKGKGVSFMEGKAEFHGVCPDEEQCAAACAELEGGC
jgi:transketolase